MNTAILMHCSRTRTYTVILLSLFYLCKLSPSAEYSFREEEISLSHNDVLLSGTLSIPSGDGPFPALILISGSGPQNRDWDFDGNGEYLMGRIVANDLVRRGIAVFRYDDRGVGKSTGEGEDIRLLTQDVTCILNHLKKNPAIGKIGFCGHSLGAEVALHATADGAPADFLILLSAPFVTGKDIMMAQAQEMPDMYRSSKTQSNEEASRDGMEFVRSIAENPLNDSSRAKAISIFEKIFRYHFEDASDEERRKEGDIEKRIRTDANNLVDHFLSPESQFFLHYDPVSDLKKVSCPIAVLFGEGDRHVKKNVNIKPLLGGVGESIVPSFTLKIVPEINHFYTAPAYRANGEMYPGVTDFISRWIVDTL